MLKLLLTSKKFKLYCQVYNSHQFYKFIVYSNLSVFEVLDLLSYIFNLYQES